VVDKAEEVAELPVALMVEAAAAGVVVSVMVVKARNNMLSLRLGWAGNKCGTRIKTNT
jgi:hypothetical protein